MSTNGTKHIATSKTAWVNALAVTIVALIPGGKEFVAENPQASIALIGLVNMGLRFITKTGVHLKSA